MILIVAAYMAIWLAEWFDLRRGGKGRRAFWCFNCTIAVLLVLSLLLYGLRDRFQFITVVQAVFGPIDRLLFPVFGNRAYRT